MSGELSRESAPDDPTWWAAVAVMGFAGAFVLVIVVAHFAGIRTQDLERRCHDHGGVVQVDGASLLRRNAFVVVCKDGVVRAVKP